MGRQLSKKNSLSVSKGSADNKVVLNAINNNDSFSKFLKEDERIFVINKIFGLYQKIKEENLKILFIEMVSKYSYFPITAYPELFKDAFKKLNEGTVKHDSGNSEITNVIWLTTALQSFKMEKLNEENADSIFYFLTQAKSSEFMSYLANGTFTKLSKETERLITFKAANNNPLLLSKVKTITEKENTYAILIDDFIGTGKQVNTCLDLYKQKKIHVDAILTLTILKTGIKNIKKENPGIKLFYAKKLPTLEDLNISKEDLDQIFSEIRNKPADNRRADSNGLVTMNRTPNNTFEIFRSSANAPFPR